MADGITIELLQSTGGLEAAARLFREFAAALGDHLDSQEIEKEITELSTRYAPPDGCILLARGDDDPIGCVAMKRADTSCCELTRLYVRPEFRGRGAGRALVSELIQRARWAGYERMRLVTATFMTSAIGVYESLGFVSSRANPATPAAGVRHMELEL